jgi:hypothetical protein
MNRFLLLAVSILSAALVLPAPLLAKDSPTLESTIALFPKELLGHKGVKLKGHWVVGYYPDLSSFDSQVNIILDNDLPEISSVDELKADINYTYTVIKDPVIPLIKEGVFISRKFSGAKGVYSERLSPVGKNEIKNFRGDSILTQAWLIDLGTVKISVNATIWNKSDRDRVFNAVLKEFFDADSLIEFPTEK